MIYRFLFTLLLTSFCGAVLGQFQEKQSNKKAQKMNPQHRHQLDFGLDEPAPNPRIQSNASHAIQHKSLSLSSLLNARKGPRVMQVSKWNIPSWIQGTPEALKGRRFSNPQEATTAYLNSLSSLLPAEVDESTYRILTVRTDNDANREHVKVQQQIQQIDIFGGEAWIHLADGMAESLTGKLYPTRVEAPKRILTSQEVTSQIEKHFKSQWKTEAPAIDGYHVKQIESKLYWYPNEKELTLTMAYVAEVYPDFMHRYFVVVNAESGQILKSYLNMCYLHGHENHSSNQKMPVTLIDHKIMGSPCEVGDQTASGVDLLGINRSFHVVDEANTFYMLDISRPMYNAGASSLPANPVGAIRTLDGLNNPFLGSINYRHVTSSSNSWTDPATISAHYNAGQAYDYFLNTFGRNSINGSGSTITSFVHVTDENDQSMDNAFWNGEAMFYGDGKQQFLPLARGLDVAGHEISHGVVQNSANLVYENESGALNESFADVFGVLIDRDDWLVGEDVVQLASFPSGALRNMQDPTQGFNSLNDPGYQPGHYNDRFTGSQDRGGVHINSGIPNRAFFLFANQVGKNVAEQVYYHALTTYLTRSSNFKDCRAAVLQSALDRYGAVERDAASSAFDQVGILGDGNNEVPGDDAELQPNPGDDLILFVHATTGNPWLVDSDLTVIAGPLSNERPISKPSVSDDGSRILFVNDQNNIHFIGVNWTNMQITDDRSLTSDGAWRNVAISKDGRLASAVTDIPENSITIFNLATTVGQTFELTNPTTGGVATGDVLYSDAMEFDYSGTSLLYDAMNEITGNTETIQYWDIGILRAWDSAADDFGDGQIVKLFSGLPDGISIGNPTLSKTRPNVLAFDLIEAGFFEDDYFLYASNVETNTTALVFDNAIVSYPSYSRTDDRILFDAENSNGEKVIGQNALLADRISPNGDPTLLLNNGRWVTWFSNGLRNVTVSTDNQLIHQNITLMPSPADDYLQIVADGKATLIDIRIWNLKGELVHKIDDITPVSSLELPTQFLSDGHYLIQIKTDRGIINRTFVVQHN